LQALGNVLLADQLVERLRPVPARNDDVLAGIRSGVWRLVGHKRLTPGR
jgi:hypothetical protein